MGVYTEISGELFGEMLKAYRKKYDVSQQVISDAIGIKRTTYAKYELGRKPDIEIISRICAYYGITTDEMLSVFSSQDGESGASVLKSSQGDKKEQSIELLNAQEKKLLELFRGSADKAAIIDFAGKIFTKEQTEELK